MIGRVFWMGAGAVLLAVTVALWASEHEARGHDEARAPRRSRKK